MRNVKSLPIKTVLCFILLLSYVAPAISDKNENLSATMYENHILPGYKELGARMGNMQKTIVNLCSTPSEENYQKALRDYRSALLSWSRVEHLRFGPVVQEYRYERFAYWPDVKGRGLRKIKVLLKKRDKSILSVENLKKKSIAFQGLTALEYLLHGEGKEELKSATDQGKYRCRFSLAIAGNLKTMSEEILSAWHPSGKFAQAFTSPTQNNIYKSRKEVIRELYQAYVSAYDRIRRLKIQRPLGLLKKKAPNPKLAPYWRSGLTIDVLSSNMQALKEMFLLGGFQELTNKTHPDLKKSVTLSIDNGLRILKGINSPVSEIIADKQKRKNYKFISSILGVMREHTGLAIVQAADLTIGFNADDGD